MEKECSHCHEVKPLSEFHKNKAQPLGVQNQCKKCRSAYNKSEKGAAARQKLQATDAYKEAQRQFFASLAGKDALKRYRESEKGVQARYRYSTSEKGRAYSREHATQNPFYRRVLCLLYNNLRCKAGARSDDTLQQVTGMRATELRQYLERDGKSVDTHHIDHIIPYAAFKRWGDLTDPLHQKAYASYKNLQLLTAFDNLSKSDKCTENEFRTYISQFSVN
jgi:hypothetical protein